MGKKIKAKVRYKKNNKAPKAFIGAATAAIGLGKSIYGGIQANRAKKAEEAFDQTRLEDQVSSATRKMADQPISQDLITGLKEQQGSNMASSMSALSKDPRNALAGINALNRNANTQNLNLLDNQQTAKTNAMNNLATEQRRVKKSSMDLAADEITGIKKERSAGVQNIFGGAEDVASGIGQMSYTPPDTAMGGVGYSEKGAKIESKEGGVTPGEFDHDSNPIDMVQDGEKIGEATGGELILPPDDVDDIREALQSEDKDAAFNLMKQLVAKYDSNVIESQESSPQGEAQEGAALNSNGIPKDKAVRIMKYVMRNDYYGSPAAPDYVQIATGELDLNDKETQFLTKYAESRKASSEKRRDKNYEKRSASGNMGGDLSMGGYLKRMVSKLKS